MLGVIVGSFLTASLGWQWTEYVETIWVYLNWASAIAFLPELYEPVLLVRRARQLRNGTGVEKFYHPHESIKLDLRTILVKYLTRPLRMFATEIMVTLIAFYAAFAYGILYATLQVVPLVFVDMRGMSTTIGSLPFFAIIIGTFGGTGINLFNQRYYRCRVDENSGNAVPEARMPPVKVGGILFFVGLLLFGWTASPTFHWIFPCLASALLGAGFVTIFQQCINFLVDTYAMYAASAVASITILRSIFAAALPFAVRPMFNQLGVGPSMSVLAIVAGFMIPVPFFFRRYGQSLRRRSNYPSAESLCGS